MARTGRWATLFFAAMALLACGGGGPSGSGPGPAPAPVSAEITLLFMGNSHTAAHDLPGLVAAMVRASRPGRSVEAVVAPGWMFLDERLRDAPSRALLASRRWSAVVLQAQKYSSSGEYLYSTDEAVQWVRLVREGGALPVLFPEWPRRGIAETERILDLHRSIALQSSACLPPIPQAFDLSLSRHPDLALHAPDGNHSSASGAFLAALAIHSALTTLPPDALPAIAASPVDADTQARLRAVAADALRAQPPRQWCPGEPPVA